MTLEARERRGRRKKAYLRGRPVSCPGGVVVFGNCKKKRPAKSASTPVDVAGQKGKAHGGRSGEYGVPVLEHGF